MPDDPPSSQAAPDDAQETDPSGLLRTARKALRAMLGHEESADGPPGADDPPVDDPPNS